MEQFNVSDPQQGHDYRYAVCGRGMIKWYGKGKKKLEVLKRMDMTLEVGRIYGLLGPSGCGKTTFLKCVLGLMQLNEGSVKVFGRAPNTPGHNVPGIAVGYMPQELALYEEFTIEENFRFYAKIYGIDNESFNERTQHLVEFLDLPSKDRPCRALSGGQKRRVSLACALFHNPKLLILDEPTVGVDPLLRSKIWNYLVQLAQEGTSIIITTHYIEEARQADCVGLMRFGHLLAEGKPEQLMAEYHKKTLEDVFLELCVKQDNAQNADDAEENKALLRHAKPDRRGELEYSSNGLSSSVRSHHHLLHDDNEPTSPMSATSSVGPGMVYHAKHESASPMRPSVRATATGRRGSDDESGAPLLADGTDSSGSLAHQRAPLQDEPELEGSGAKESCYSYWCPRRNQTWAVVWKAFKGMQRNIAFLVFQFLLPSIQVALFCLAIGKDPTDLNIAITNLDQGLSLPLANCTIPASAQGLSSHPFPSSHWARGLIGSGSEAGVRGDSSVINLGALFVTKIPSSLNVKLYSNFDDAVASTHAGKTWGSVFIPANFSVDLEARFVSPVPSQATLDGSTITMRLDESDEQIAITVVNAINEAFSNMLQDKDLNRCIQGVASKASSPVQNGKPVYGFDNPKFTDFIAPGMIVTISFAQAIGLTSAVFTQDKATGNLDRQWAAGIRPYEIMIGQLLSQFVMLLTQILCLLFVALVIFSLPMDGSIFLVIFLALELGVSGMMYGLTIASNADDQQEATQLALASFFPVLLLSGVIWPREGMPKALQYISYALPTTWAADSMRSIMNRGWDISYPDVYHGFLIVLAWIILLFLWSTRGLRKQTQ